MSEARNVKRMDVCALGELLIDFTQNGVSAQGNPLFEANPGGAPCNVLAMLTKLGHTTSFAGKVGDDMFGRALRQRVDALGIDTRGLREDAQARTTLAFVQTLPGGDRDFSFYRNPGADMLLRADEIDEAYVADARIFHFGTLSMTHPEVRAATQKAVLCARRSGALISFDPNIRPPLWEDMEECRRQVLWGIEACDILKIADNELVWLTGLNEEEDAITWLRTRYPNVRLLLLSLGKRGSIARCGTAAAQAATFSNVATIETTGAGDTFCGCCLHFVLTHGLEALEDAALLQRMLQFANAAASLITTRKGALCVMPEQREIFALLESAQPEQCVQKSAQPEK